MNCTDCLSSPTVSSIIIDTIPYEAQGSLVRLVSTIARRETLRAAVYRDEDDVKCMGDSSSITIQNTTPLNAPHNNSPLFTAPLVFLLACTATPANEEVSWFCLIRRPVKIWVSARSLPTPVLRRLAVCLQQQRQQIDSIAICGFWCLSCRHHQICNMSADVTPQLLPFSFCRRVDVQYRTIGCRLPSSMAI